MILLSGANLENAKDFLKIAQEEAKKSTCLSRRCGAILVKDSIVIGKGFNSPPRNLDSQKRCGLDKKSLDAKVTDKTCCIHAEQRAIFDALFNGMNLSGSTMYFTSIDENGNQILSRKPYCTLCSKMALDVGVKYWVLEHEKGIFVYGAEEYNKLSFEYKK